jgi:hypothetical protein
MGPPIQRRDGLPEHHLEGGNPARGRWAPPGRYQVRLEVDDEAQTRWFHVDRDPRLTDVTDADLTAQFDLARKIRDAESAANESVVFIRDLRSQVQERLGKTDDTELHGAAEVLVKGLGAVERKLYQVENQSPKDKIAFPIQLNDRLTGLCSHLEHGDAPPTRAYYPVFEELSAELEGDLNVLDEVTRTELLDFNRRLAELGLETVRAEKPSVLR